MIKYKKNMKWNIRFNSDNDTWLLLRNKDVIELSIDNNNYKYQGDIQGYGNVNGTIIKTKDGLNGLIENLNNRYENN